MPKKKSKSKQRKSKRSSAAPKKQAARSKRIVKSKSAKRSAARKAAKKKTASRTSRGRKPQAPVSTERELRQELRRKNQAAAGLAASRQTGDLEGLSRAEEADSESVEELVEEGNIFEAGAVAGVEEADDAGEKEVHTHEVPEDDVPEEYLDED